MRDFASCFSEYAVQVSDNASCSSYSNSSSCITPNSIPSIQNTVTCLYKTIVQSQKQILITLTWSKNNLSQGLNITFNDDASNAVKLNTNSRLFRKLKGTKFLELQSYKIELLWDLSSARYESGPEPESGYYVVVTVDSQVCLIVGDMSEEALVIRNKVNKTGCCNNNSTRVAKFSLISRQEHFSGNTHYSTKAQFTDSGNSHDILIRCSGENNDGLKYPVLSVSIDKKTVIRVKRLQWNFRGNQTIFLDGLLVDLMWDVHDWFYNPGSGYAVFMFRTRSGLDSRLWLEEKMVHKDNNNQDKVEFSLMIYACKNL